MSKWILAAASDARLHGRELEADDAAAGSGGHYKRIVARTITPATPQITTIANRKCMATPPLPKDHRDGDRRDYTPHETHRYYRVHSETYPRLNHLGDR